MSHAKLSPSAADRWMVCPGSVVLSEGMPQKTSAFAEEGTRAHELAEAWLRGGIIVADPEMLGHVQIYVDHVRSLLGESDYNTVHFQEGSVPLTGIYDMNNALHIEQRVKVNEHVYGTADAVVWQADAKHLHIVDLKYGAGVPVEVDGNLQLKIYALAALLTFNYLAHKVTATIVQPRCPHGDGPVRSVTFSAVDLIDFHADIEEAVELVNGATEVFQSSIAADHFEKTLTPSEKGCRWCLASPKCPALKNKAQTLAKQAFAPGLPYDPKALAETLDFLPILEGWIKNTREFAYGEAEKGSAIPNWKLVEKRASRKWRDDGVVAQTLSAVVDPTFLYERKLITPAAAEKLLPKEQRALLDELCVKESSGHTLVHQSDKRPAVKVDAKSAFANS